MKRSDYKNNDVANRNVMYDNTQLLTNTCISVANNTVQILKNCSVVNGDLFSGMFYDTPLMTNTVVTLKLQFPEIFDYINNYDIVCQSETKQNHLDFIDISEYVMYYNNRRTKKPKSSSEDIAALIKTENI